MIVILVNGFPGCGKDTFIDITSYDFKCFKHSTIDACKVFAKSMGWDGVKEFYSRKMLSDLKKFYVEHFDGPFRDLVKAIKVNKNSCDIFFTTSREGNEIHRLKCWCEQNNIPFYYIFIVRKGVSTYDYGNDSDNNAAFDSLVAPDYLCYNKWDNKEDYREEIIRVVKDVLKKFEHNV